MQLQEEKMTFDLESRSHKIATLNVVQHPLHHVIYAATKLEVATSNSLGGETFTRKYII